MKIEQIDSLQVHFVLCTERTGSSLLSLMLNINPKILSPSEEPFAMYFYKKYRNKILWSEKDIEKYVDQFWLMAEKNLSLYFTSKKQLFNDLKKHREVLNYERLIKITYLNFLEPKPKVEVQIIVDKQIKYFFYLPHIFKIFPKAKFIVLTRDVRDNIVLKSDRKLNWINQPIFLSALWNKTYQNIQVFEKLKRNFIIVKYEDLVTDTEVVLSKICDYLEVPFDEKMLHTSEVYQQFLTHKTDKISSKFLTDLTRFHSGMFQKPNADKIGIYKLKGEDFSLDKVEYMNYDLLNSIGYEVSIKEKNRFSFKDYWYIFLAYLYRPFLLRLYYIIPLNIKLFIKTIRIKRIDV
jgi:hypothetical protein